MATKKKTSTTKKKKKDSASKGSVRMHSLRWSTKERTLLAESLNELLANYEVHYQKLRNYHWNVTGGDFFDIHENLELQYT